MISIEKILALTLTVLGLGGEMGGTPVHTIKPFFIFIV